jgi:hypothetical protein
LREQQRGRRVPQIVQTHVRQRSSMTTIYTDGSVTKNPGGRGGFACIVVRDDRLIRAPRASRLERRGLAPLLCGPARLHGTNIRAWATEIEQLLPPLATGHLRDTNGDSSGMVFITGTPYYWTALPPEAHAHQARALAEYRGSRTLSACSSERFLTTGSRRFVTTPPL